MQRVPLYAVAIIALAAGTIVAVGRPAVPSAPPLDLSDAGIYGPDVVRNAEGDTLLYNFRTVEPGVVYRGSEFARTNKNNAPQNTGDQPPAFRDEQLFFFLRTMKIRQVVSLAARPDFEVERGYLRYWSERTGYVIEAISLPVALDHAYGRDDLSGLHAAAELLQIMKVRRPADGAVLVHGDTGTDGTGIAVAAFELWRTYGRSPEDAAWQRVLQRYLASNELLSKDASVAALAGERVSCAGGALNYVCAERLERLRGDLLFLAKL